MFAKWDWKQWNWKHTLSIILFFAAGGDELLRQWLAISPDNTLPWHITAASLVLVAKYIDMISHSMTGSTGSPDMLGTVAPGAPADVKAAADAGKQAKS
jgi:hypothetical protein